MVEICSIEGSVAAKRPQKNKDRSELTLEILSVFGNLKSVHRALRTVLSNSIGKTDVLAEICSIEGSAVSKKTQKKL